MGQTPIVIIGGPSRVGKSDLANRLAEHSLLQSFDIFRLDSFRAALTELGAYPYSGVVASNPGNPEAWKAADAISARASFPYLEMSASRGLPTIAEGLYWPSFVSGHQWPENVQVVSVCLIRSVRDIDREVALLKKIAAKEPGRFLSRLADEGDEALARYARELGVWSDAMKREARADMAHRLYDTAEGYEDTLGRCIEDILWQMPI